MNLQTDAAHVQDFFGDDVGMLASQSFTWAQWRKTKILPINAPAVRTQNGWLGLRPGQVVMVAATRMTPDTHHLELGGQSGRDGEIWDGGQDDGRWNSYRLPRLPSL